MTKPKLKESRGSAFLGTLTLTLFLINIILVFPFILIFSILKLFPCRYLKKSSTQSLNKVAWFWIKYNSLWIDKFMDIKIKTHMPNNLSPEKWYLIVSNHQSMVDIPILQKIFLDKIQIPKFFIKSQLIWIPILGMAWWAMDYPFMKRYSKEFIEKNPHLKGKDMESTIKACRKYREMPVSVINFTEGTRYTEEKALKQGSPYKNLLKPKAGGVGYVFTALGDFITSILNVTIIYPKNTKRSLWNFLCGRLTEFTVYVEEIEFTENLKGNYSEDDRYNQMIRTWINRLWEEKDKKFSLIN